MSRFQVYQLHRRAELRPGIVAFGPSTEETSSDRGVSERSEQAEAGLAEGLAARAPIAYLEPVAVSLEGGEQHFAGHIVQLKETVSEVYLVEQRHFETLEHIGRAELPQVAFAG